ncbi:MAG: hypothetical protein KBA51_07995 [Kiritimatiellae bacterium]|nr:hypothetical protein [Kiritimatiellia bacterium]
MNLAKRMGWGLALCALCGATRTLALPESDPAAAKPDAVVTNEDTQYVLDRIIELEKSRIQHQMELERYRARKAELDKQMAEWAQKKQELERRQAELMKQMEGMEPAPEPETPGWYAALGPLDLHAEDTALPLVRVAAGGYLRVLGKMPDGRWRVRLRGVEYAASPADHLMEDTAVRGRLEKSLAEAGEIGDTNRVERIRVTLDRLRLQRLEAEEEEMKTGLAAEPANQGL